MRHTLSLLSLALVVAACGGDDGPAFLTDTSTVRDAADVPALTDVGDPGGGDGSDAGDVADVAEVADASDGVSDAMDIDGGDADAPLEVGDDADADDDTIGPSGGVVSFPGVSLVVPAGALAEPVTIAISLADDQRPEGFRVDTPVFRFEPAGLEFAVPAQVCLRLDGVRPANMTLFWTDRDDVFGPLAGREGARQICALVDHFSRGFVGGYDEESCQELDCEPFVGRCDGDVATAPTLAVCLDATCVAPTDVRDCAALGRVCVDGECLEPAVCGDDVLADAFEECDGDELAGTRCTDFGWEGGTLGCGDDCRFDLSECTGDPCADVVCDVAPEPECRGSVVVEFGEPTCARGECVWVESTTDCGAEGDVCIDGACIAGPAPEDLVITEYLANSVGAEDPDLEWFEVRNDAGHEVALLGLEVSDDNADTFTIGAPIILDDGQYAVLGASSAATPDVDYAWDGRTDMALANGDDEIVLSFAGEEIDRVAYDDGAGGWPDPDGASVSLGPEAADNAGPGGWCTTRAGPYDDAGNRGTPGAPNPNCTAACGDAIVDDGEDCDDGNTDDGDGCPADCLVYVDPCEDVVCDDPPPAECDGDTVITWADDGTCDDGECVYEPSGSDCSTSGATCFEAACVEVAVGDLIITEFEPDPAGAEPDMEWFEVTNPTDEPITITGLVVSEAPPGTESFSVSGDVSIGPGEWFVFGGSAAAAGGPNFIWSGSFRLANSSADEIVLTLDGVELDRVAYDAGWPFEEGVPAALGAESVDVDANDDPGAWCAGGTPGRANPTCSADCTGDEQCTSPPPNTCEGDVVVSYRPTGTCSDGTCLYDEGPGLDCGAVDRTCLGGTCVASGEPAPGDIVIVEYMANPEPTDTDNEWFEVLNTTDAPISLNGLVVSDGHEPRQDEFEITEDVVVPANGHFVFAETFSAAPDEVDFAWNDLPAGSFQLANSDDEIVLVLGGVELDRVEYTDAGTGGWPDPTGASVSLDPGSEGRLANDDPANWCVGTGVYAGINEGTPGQPNPECDAL